MGDTGDRRFRFTCHWEHVLNEVREQVLPPLALSRQGRGNFTLTLALSRQGRGNEIASLAMAGLMGGVRH